MCSIFFNDFTCKAFFTVMYLNHGIKTKLHQCAF
jgi:hypothetical protein